MENGKNFTIKKSLLLTLILFIQAMVLTAKSVTNEAIPPVIYVNEAATGANDGLTWEDAFTKLQDALYFANNSSGAVYEVWVAAGTYYPDEGQLVTDGDRDASFELAEGLSLIGGFAGGEIDPFEADPNFNVTILSGDIDQNDGANPVVDPLAITGANSKTVVYIEPSIIGDFSWMISGFTITAGNADGGILEPLRSKSGGGIFNEGSISLNELTVIGNKATTGAGIYLFRNNYATASGGAVFNDGRGSGECLTGFFNSVFEGNSAGSSGGAMYNDGSSGGFSAPFLLNCTLSNNSAINAGSCIYNHFAYPTIFNCILYSNDSFTFPISDFNSNVVIIETTVEGNYGGMSSVDPMFVIGPAQSTSTNPINLELQAISPAIDQGSNEHLSLLEGKDFNGNPRNVGGTVDRGAYEVQAVALPVDLVDFRATLLDNQEVQLAWHTSTETNSAYFEVERSEDGESFHFLEKITAAGNASSPSHYQTIDRMPHANTNYYRLKTLDLDGAYEYSNIQIVALKDLKQQVELYPNPTSDYLNIVFNDFDNQDLTIRVKDITGKILYENSLSIEHYEMRMELADIQNYTAGVYFVQIIPTNQLPIERTFIKVD